MPRIVAVAFPKGGTAKSQSAANLAAVAAMEGHRTLLIDLDPQGSSGTLVAGVQCDDEDNCASALFRDQPRFASEIAQASKHGFDVVPAGPGLIGAEDWIARAPLGEQKLRSLLRKDRGLDKYDLVIIDTVGAKVRLLTSVLMAATDVLIPMTTSILSTNELPEFMDLVSGLSEIRQDMNDAPINILGVFFVRTRSNTKAARLAFEELNDAVKQGFVKRLETVIPESTAIENAARLASPVVCYDRNAPVSQQYVELFREIFGASAVLKEVKRA